MKPTPFGNAALGMDVLSEETALPEGAQRDILNFDIGSTGRPVTRRGATLLGALDGAHSMWSPRHQRFGFFVQGDALRLLTVEGADVRATTLLSGLTPGPRMRYAEFGDDVFFTNGRELGTYGARGARLLGIDRPLAPEVSAVQGGLAPGRYGVAVAVLSADGEESGLSAARFVDVGAGGIAVSLPALSAGAARVYATATDGDVLYQVEDVPAGMLAFTISSDRRGKAASSQYQERMLPGDDISIFAGRVITSRGSVLRWSEAFAYGRTDPRFNHLDFTARILFHEPVADGLYVGTEHGTYFLAGTNPRDWQQVRVASPAVVDDSVGVPATALGGTSDAITALWIGRNGYALGAAGGAVQEPQAARISLPAHGDGALVSFTFDGLTRAMALVEATATEAAALNSLVE